MRFCTWATAFLSLTVVSASTVQLRQNLEVIEPEEAKNMFVRFQIPRDGQSRDDARVTTTDWQTTSAQVASTMVDYFNVGGGNAMLWRQWGTTTLAYAGYHQSRACRGQTAQDGLNGDNVSITFILGGKQKLRCVGPEFTDGWSQQDIEATSHIFGINGQISDRDLVYMSGSSLKQSVNDAIASYEAWRKTAYVNGPKWEGLMHFKAVRADGSEVHISTEFFP